MDYPDTRQGRPDRGNNISGKRWMNKEINAVFQKDIEFKITNKENGETINEISQRRQTI